MLVESVHGLEHESGGVGGGGGVGGASTVMEGSVTILMPSALEARAGVPRLAGVTSVQVAVAVPPLGVLVWVAVVAVAAVVGPLGERVALVVVAFLPSIGGGAPFCVFDGFAEGGLEGIESVGIPVDSIDGARCCGKPLKVGVVDLDVLGALAEIGVSVAVGGVFRGHAEKSLEGASDLVARSIGGNEVDLLFEFAQSVTKSVG